MDDRASDTAAGQASLREWLSVDLARVAGLARRVIDPDSSTQASESVAVELAVRAIAVHRKDVSRPTPQRSARLVATVLDECVPHLLGNPGRAAAHPDVLGADADSIDHLTLAELHQAISSARRPERRAGLLVLAAGYRPQQAAALVDQSLEDVLGAVARIGTRLSDARRIGDLTPAGSP